MIARIIVTPKKSVLDPQGEAVRRAIHALGFDAVASARIGKYIELDVTGTNVEAIGRKLEEISADLLSNPVVEDYTLQLDAIPAPTKTAISSAIEAIRAEPEPKAEKTAKPAAKKATPKAKAPAPAPKKAAVPSKAAPAPAKKTAKKK